MLTRSNVKPFQCIISFNPQDNLMRFDYFYWEVLLRRGLRFCEAKPKMTELYAPLINHNQDSNNNNGSYLLNYYYGAEC